MPFCFSATFDAWRICDTEVAREIRALPSTPGSSSSSGSMLTCWRGGGDVSTTCSFHKLAMQLSHALKHALSKEVRVVPAKPSSFLVWLMLDGAV
jgi:hypothetical protein